MRGEVGRQSWRHTAQLPPYAGRCCPAAGKTTEADILQLSAFPDAESHSSQGHTLCRAAHVQGLSEVWVWGSSLSA